MLRLLVLVSLIAAPSYVVSAQEAHKGAREVAFLLNVGDESAIDRMHQDGRIGSAVSEFVESASRPDRKNAEGALNECRASGESAGDGGAAISCGLFLAGLHAANGDAPKWGSAWQWLRSSGVRLLTNGSGKGTLGKGFDNVDFAKIAANMPDVSYEFSSDQSDLKTAPSERSDPTPRVMIEVGGKQVSALVDTGAAATLIVPKHMANELSLRMVATGLTVIKTAVPYLTSSDTTIGKDSYYLADFTIGNLKGKNVLVLVTERPFKDVVVGNEILSMFGEVRFDEDSVALSRPGSSLANKCVQKVPMKFLPTQQFHGQFVIPAKINGQKARLSLDSGAGPEFIIVGHAAKQFSGAPRRMHDATVGGMPAKIGVGKAPILLSIGQSIDRSVQASVVQGPNTNFDAILGAPLLKNGGVTINFDSGHVCF